MENRKNEIITIRCTTQEKNKIRRKAEEKNKGMGVYILDSAIAGLERRSSKDKKRVVRMIERQEKLNEIHRQLSSDSIGKQDLYELLKELIDEEKKEWLN